jgi:hypothetical protein
MQVKFEFSNRLNSVQVFDQDIVLPLLIKIGLNSSAWGQFHYNAIYFLRSLTIPLHNLILLPTNHLNLPNATSHCI